MSRATPGSEVPEPNDEDIDITNTSSGEKQIAGNSNNNAKAKKGKAASKKDETNAGAVYYSEMLLKQTDLMKLRKELLTSKLKTGKLETPLSNFEENENKS
eukprot:GFUD01099997.1.p1 GENE.GFUD01099997.1~~GFUD01099997.1.p1  ORF type:complete len:101 (-),score=32.97 GFUD01099997.1:91-393(-)